MLLHNNVIELLQNNADNFLLSLLHNLYICVMFTSLELLDIFIKCMIINDSV